MQYWNCPSSLVHLELPFYGARRMKDELREKGFVVGRDHV
jgi:hypothetical protein